MTLPFSPGAEQLATLQYVWFGPYNQTVWGNQDTTTLSVVWFGPYNYAAPWISGPPQPQYLPHSMFLMMT